MDEAGEDQGVSVTRVGPRSIRDLPAAQRRAIHGWSMYDWANSGFATSIGTAILPVYFVTLFRDAFGQEAQILGFALTGSSVWSLGVAASTAIVAFSSPVLGVIADRTSIKKTLLWSYTAAGALFTFLSFFSAYTGAAWAWVLGCFLVANVGFAGGNLFYNAFLPHLAPKELLDDISSRGYAYGYVGGGLLLAIHLVFIIGFRETAHIDLVTRGAIASVGVWWFGWAIWTFKTVPEPHIPNPLEGLTVGRATRIAVSELQRTLRELTRFRVLVVYLVAYLLFNDGIQTVLVVAGAFGAETLGVSLEFNMGTVLIVQFVAAVGAMLFSWLAGRLGTKKALGLALLGWCMVITLAIGFAPLYPEAHEEFDYRLEYLGGGLYELVEAPDTTERDGNAEWHQAFGHLRDHERLSRSSAAKLADAVGSSIYSRFSISIRGGPLGATVRIGPHHPANLQGPVDLWPRALREFVWKPLGMGVDLQWLLLGILLGVVIGGSQALARSLFAYMTPWSRSAEFFGFFGFVNRASAVFGPAVYLLFTGVYDTRVAVLAVLLLIVGGTVMLRWVDVEEGHRVATYEDSRRRPPLA